MLQEKINSEDFFATKLPGVTTVLSNVFGKDEFSGIPESVMKAATERGHKVHEYIEYYIKNGEWPEIELAYQIYIDYFNEWLNKYKPTFLSSELKLISEDLGYKGIIDTIFKYTNDEGKEIICMCDWKTSSNLNRFKTMMQLNMYKELFNQYFPDIHIDEIRTLSITKLELRFSKFVINKAYVDSILLFNGLKNELK